MQTGYSIFGGPVETMDGPVRAVSIQPRYIRPGAFSADTAIAVATPPSNFGPIMRAVAPTRIAAPIASTTPPSSYTGRRPQISHPGVPRAGITPHGYTPHQGAPLPAHPQYPGSMLPPPNHMIGTPLPAQPPPGFMVPGPAPSPHQPWQRPHSHHMTPTPMGPAPTPCTCPPVPVPPSCGCPTPMPMPPIQYYNPTPSAPISPRAGFCPPSPIGPMTDGCGNPIAGGTGANLFHPGGAYPITNHGPGLNDGLTRRQVMHGQLPVGAGTDIFGGTVNAEDPMSSRMIGPTCGGGQPSQAQPQHAYNHYQPCGGHVPGTGHGAGIFGVRSGVFGAGPDGL